MMMLSMNLHYMSRTQSAICVFIDRKDAGPRAFACC